MLLMLLVLLIYAHEPRVGSLRRARCRAITVQTKYFTSSLVQLWQCRNVLSCPAGNGAPQQQLPMDPRAWHSTVHMYSSTQHQHWTGIVC